MAKLGADVEALEGLAQRVDRWSRQLTGTATSVGAAVAATFWQGPDASTFRTSWRTKHRPQLDTVGTDLADLATVLRHHAREQRRASAGAGTTPMVPVPIIDDADDGGGTAAPSTEIDIDDLTAEQKDALAYQFAPVLRFDEEEDHYLGNHEDFIANSSLRAQWTADVYDPHTGDGWTEEFDEEIIPAGEVDPNDLPPLDPDKTYYYDLQREQTDWDGDVDESQLLYEVGEDGRGKYVTYWLHYPYNNGPAGQVHEGDEERIEVRLDDAYAPQGVAYSGHSTPTWRDWDDVELTDDDRPIAYVADGTHANYPESGVWDTDAPTALGFINEDAFGEGIEHDLLTDSGPAVDITTEPYYASGIRHGDQGSESYYSGPTAPGDKGTLYEHDGLNEDEPNGGLDKFF